MKSKIVKSTDELIKHIVPLILEDCSGLFRKVEKTSTVHAWFPLSAHACFLLPIVSLVLWVGTVPRIVAAGVGVLLPWPQVPSGSKWNVFSLLADLKFSPT